MHLFHVIGEGLMTGAALSLMLGTVFFSLLRNSLQFGYQTGFYIASGVIVCDIMFIALVLLSHQFALFLKTYSMLFSLAGGIILMAMGIIMFVKASPKVLDGELMSARSNLYYFFNGFLLNLLNPVNFFSWLAISTMLTVRFNFNITDKVYFFTAALFSIFIVEILIAVGAARIKQWVTPKLLKRINQISGLIFFGVGVKLALVVFY